VVLDATEVGLQRGLTTVLMTALGVCYFCYAPATVPSWCRQGRIRASATSSGFRSERFVVVLGFLAGAILGFYESDYGFARGV